MTKQQKDSDMSKFDIDTHAVRVLAELLQKTGLSEIEYAEGERRIKVVGACAGGAPSVVQVAAPAPVAEVKPAEAEVKKTGTTVNAPMVGSVYMAGSPNAAPFVKVGDKVKQGDTLLIIEAMKVMNPIKAPVAGEIVEIYASDAKPVEFGEPLMLIA